MQSRTNESNVLLWTVQMYLAGLFLFAGAVMLLMPALTRQATLSESLVRCIGVAEVVGALGLTLPKLMPIRTIAAPLAAAGLIVIMFAR